MQPLPKLDFCQQITDRFPGVTFTEPEDQILPSLRSHYEGENEQLAGHKERYREIAEDKVHFERSHSDILSGATGLKGAALIVGIGNATDIPFKELAKQFDKVTVVEMDPKSITRALSLLDKDLLKKITVVVADLTGCMAAFSKEMESVKNRTRTAEDFLKGFMNILPSLKPKSLAALGERQFDYVVSHLVLTQLTTIPVGWVGKTAEKLPTTEPMREIPNAPLLTFVNTLQHQHIRDLHNWVKDFGKVYVSDTSASYLCLRLEPQGQPHLYRRNPACSIASAIEDVASKLFKKRESSKPWAYYNQPPAHEANAQGTAYIVQAFLFEGPIINP